MISTTIHLVSSIWCSYFFATRWGCCSRNHLIWNYSSELPDSQQLWFPESKACWSLLQRFLMGSVFYRCIRRFSESWGWTSAHGCWSHLYHTKSGGKSQSNVVCVCQNSLDTWGESLHLQQVAASEMLHLCLSVEQYNHVFKCKQGTL
jgi:hypothetical protein